ncbi:SMI1/KNR4 family protein [Marinococcus luteus]|uniref:SMI1/KNR4 family protein n=1 Tax=Marinococcus luteus TaxID=1122204 RepID=UPI002ACC478A|nr:SMI1/KNR4 family protein [Marinococcus luteus]MDZ5783371.1 SMI1/KNR4 family protein [Marinococcus luteus]
MEWKYCKKQITENDLYELESLFKIELPREYKKILRECNGGRPRFNVYDSLTEKERMVKGLLPIGEEYNNNPLQVKDLLEKKSLERLVPFAEDPGGNYLCFKYINTAAAPKVVLWEHETNNTEEVADSFEEFLGKLYKI